MTMTLVWTGVALWLVLNAAIAARCRYVALPAKTTVRPHPLYSSTPGLSLAGFIVCRPVLIFGMIR